MIRWLIILLLIVGCEGVYTPKDNVHPLIGSWKLMVCKTLSSGVEEIIYADDEFYAMLIINENETFNYSGNFLNNEIYNGTWSTSNDTLTLSSVANKFKYSINIDTLTLDHIFTWDSWIQYHTDKYINN